MAVRKLDIEWTHLRQVLEDFAEYLIEQAKKNLSQNKSYASGELADSMDYVIEIEEDRFTVYIEMATYWDYLEYGRKAGKRPPVYKIYEWITEKGIAPRPVTPSVESLSYAIQKSIKDRKGYTVPRVALLEWIKKKGIKPEAKVPSVMSLAWAISTNIGKYGTKPHPFFEKAKEDALRRYEEPIFLAIREDIETYLEEQLADIGKIF